MSTTIEAVAKSVHDLAEHVQGMKAGLVDQDTVRQIAEEVLTNQEAARRDAKGSGYEPQDEDAEKAVDMFGRLNAADRFDLLHQRPAGWVAARTTRAVEDVRHFQSTADNLLMMAVALGKDPRDLRYYADEYVPAFRAAMDTATTAEGQEYVPRYLSADLIERINLDLQVVALFPTVAMPSNPFDIPGRGVSRQRTFKHTEQIADTGQTTIGVLTPATRKVTLTAAKFAGQMLTSKELEEDALLAILPFMQEELVDYITADLEDAGVNGNIAGTLDSDATGATDPRRNWDGLRTNLIAGGKTDGANGKLTVAMLRTNRSKMGKYGVRPGELAHIVSMANYIQLLDDTSVLTLEKYGPNATILNGELARVDGSPVVVSEYVRQNLNATGAYDGTTTNRSIALTANRRGFVTGERRGMTLQRLVELYATADQDAIIGTVRKAFAARFPTATEKVVSATYNLLT